MPTLITDPEELKTAEALLNAPLSEETSIPGGLPSDSQDIYTQPDKTVSPGERLRLQSEATTGVETTGWGVAKSLLGDIAFFGDARKIAQKKALSDIIQGKAEGLSVWGETFLGPDKTAVEVKPFERGAVDLPFNPTVLEDTIAQSGLDLDAIKQRAEGITAFHNRKGSNIEYGRALHQAARLAAEDEMAKRVHVSSRASRALPGEGKPNKEGFGYSVVGGGLQNVPYMAQFAIGSALGAGGIALPLLASFDRRLQENMESEYRIDPSTGGVKQTEAGMSLPAATAPSAVGAVGETGMEVVGGKIASKALKLLGGGVMKATGADKLVAKVPFIRALSKSFDDIAKVTQVQEYPVEILEELGTNLWDAGFRTTKEYQTPEGLGDRFVNATKAFGRDLPEIALSMLLVQGGQLAIASPRAISEIQSGRKAERNAADILKTIPGVDQTKIDAIMQDQDARAVFDYISSLSPEQATEAAKRMSARSVQAADEVKKTVEWMDALGDKGAESRFAMPTPDAFAPQRDNTSVYVDPASNIRLTRDSATGEIEVMNLDTGRTAYVNAGTEEERMQRAASIANAFDRESQGRDIVNTKKRDMLSKLLESKGVEGKYVIVDSEDALLAQEALSDKAKNAVAFAKSENGRIPQAFVDDGNKDAPPTTYFVLDNIRMGEGAGAIGKTLRNIVDAATHEPFHRARYANAETSKIFKDMYDKSSNDLRLDVIKQGIALTDGKDKVDDTLKNLAASADDTVTDADSKDKALRRYFEEGVAYGIEGTVSEQSTGYEKTMNRLREFFKADIKTTDTLRVMAEQAMAKAKGKVTIERGVPIVSGVNADEQAQEAKQEGLVIEVPPQQEAVGNKMEPTAAPVSAENAQPSTQAEAPVQKAPESIQVAPEEAAMAQMEEPTAEPPPVAEVPEIVTPPQEIVAEQAKSAPVVPETASKGQEITPETPVAEVNAQLAKTKNIRERGILSKKLAKTKTEIPTSEAKAEEAKPKAFNEMTKEEFEAMDSTPTIKERFKAKKDADVKKQVLEKTIAENPKMLERVTRYGLTPKDLYVVKSLGKGKYGVVISHQQALAASLQNEKPVNASAVDAYGIKLPEGYVREGDMYIFKPQQQKEAPNAESIRSDEGQVRQGRQEGQPGVRRGAVQGGRNLQQPKSKTPRVQQEKVTETVSTPPAREPDAQTSRPTSQSPDVSAREGSSPVAKTRIPKGAKVVTTYDDKGVSFSGEFVRDNGDGTATFRAFGSRPRKGLFRRFGVDAKGVQITKEMTVPSDTLKATEPMGDLNRMTPAQREAYKAMVAAQDARMEAEIAAGRSVNADELTRRAMAEERRQAAKEDGIRMRVLGSNVRAFDMDIKLKPKEEKRVYVRTAIAAIRRRMLAEKDKRGAGGRFQAVEPVYDSQNDVSRQMGEAAIREIERIFRKTIVFVDGGDGLGGFVSRDYPDIIFINARTTIPYLQILGHELSHTMSIDNPSLYSDVTDMLIPIIEENPQLEKLIPAGALTNKDEVEEYTQEMTANLFAEHFTNPDFWALVHNENPPLFKRLTDYILRWIDKVFSEWKGPSFDTSPLFGDLKKTRGVVARAVARYGTSQQMRKEGTTDGQESTLSADTGTDSLQRSLQDAGRQELPEDVRGGSRQRQEDDGNDRGTEAEKGGVNFRMDQTDTPSFLNWFRDSKVVDADGKPLVVYHGTGAKFTVFGGNEQWFSRDRDYAEEMSIIKDTPEVLEAYLSIQNPLRVTMDISEFGVDYYENDYLQQAKAEGRDGVIFTSDDESFESYVTFSPSQIKSATANTGAFDPANPDIRFSMQQDDDAKKQKAKNTFDRLLPLMDNPVDEYRSPTGIPIVQPQVLDKAQLDRIVKAFDADAELPTPSSVNRKAQIQDALSAMNESEIRDTVSAIANDRRDWDVDDDTLFKMRLFLMKREGDVASYKGQMDAAERNGDAGRINMISDMTAGAEYDIVQTANALSKAGSKRGQALQALQTGMDRDYNIVYRVRQFRKTTGRDVSVEDYRRIAEAATKDAAEQKKNYDELRKTLAEEEKKRFEDAISKAKKAFDAQVEQAYRKGARDERDSFEYLLNDPDAEPIRRIDPAAGFEGIDIGGIAFRVEDSTQESKAASYPGALRDLARKIFTEVQAEGGGVVVFGRRMLEQGRAKGFKGDMIARYVYDFSKRLGIAEVTPTKKMPVRTTDKGGKVRKFKNENDRRKFEVKEAVKRAVAEDLSAPGNKVAQRAAEILEADMSDFAYLTPEEIYGVVTGYPTTPEADTRDELIKRYDMIRRHMLALQRTGEMAAGVYPTKMTRGMDAPDVTLRQLSREVRDMMNNFTFPADAEDPRLMNAQKALANRLQYAVEELQKAVDTGTPINEKAPRAVEETPEIRRLRATLRDLRTAYEAMPSVEAIREVRDTERARRSANKRYHFWNKRLEDAKNGVFPETFKGTETAEKDAEIASYKAKAEAAQREYWQIKKASPQERLAVLTEKVTKAEERLASLEEALAQTPVADPAKPKTPFVPANAEEAAAQAKLEATRQAIDNVRKAIAAKWRDENAEAVYKVKEAERFQFLTQKAAAIEKKIKDKDFTKAPKRQPVTSGRIVIAQEKVRQGQRTIEERIQWEANQAAGWTGKAKNVYNMSGNLYRFFKASYDISNVGVQSARLFTAHPLIGARLIRDSVSNALTDEKTAEYMAAMHMDADYEKAYNDGLALDQQFDDVFGTGMGESVFRGFVERSKTGGLLTRVGGVVATGALMSQRAFDIYGRAMRFEVYKSIVNDPAHANLSPIQRKAVANMVNIMGGIGNTKMYNHNFAAVLSNLMWSSRLFTAQIQTAMGGGGLLWNAGMGPEDSKANTGREWYETAAPGALKLYARSIAGNIALAQIFAAVGMMLGDRQPWEDEETLFWKAYNFLFGRPVIGSKNFDFSGGLTTYTAMMRKFMDGTHVAMSGRDVSDEGFAGKVKLLSNFFRGRLRPDLAVVLNVAFGEDVTGEKFGPRAGMEGMSNMFWETVLPITPLAVYETTKDIAKTHGWSGIAFGLVPSLAGDVFGFAKGGQPRDSRYEIERHKSHMGQVNKALKVAKETGDTSEYIRLRDLYMFDVQVNGSVSKLDAAGKKALKVADDKRYPEATREKAKADAERMFATARDILLGNRK